jgi:diguanylate cyclase (GGDEF)-like protein
MQCSALLITILSTVGTACSFLILNTYRMENDLQSATRKIENLANVDGLTVLYNRRYFDQRLELETRRQQRNGRPLSLLMADIDSFKPFNDTYGHQAGDECLRNVAAVLKKSGARSSDITARYGGEEFVMLLPDTDEHGAMRVATTVQSGIRELGIRHESSTISDIVTLSIGITTVTPDRRMLPEEIIQLADNALYKSKRNGKNQIQVQTR